MDPSFPPLFAEGDEDLARVELLREMASDGSLAFVTHAPAPGSFVRAASPEEFRRLVGTGVSPDAGTASPDKPRNS